MDLSTNTHPTPPSQPQCPLSSQIGSTTSDNTNNGSGSAPDGPQPISAGETPVCSGLVTLRTKISMWLHLPSEDADLIDLVLATYMSNKMPGDPLWLLIIDGPGGGKTELLRPLRKRSDAFFLSSLTDKTLISGYRDPKHPTNDPSLLPKLNGKVLVIKDLSPLLAMRRDTRNTILADLRDAYDGFTDQGRGNLGRITYDSRFSLIAASTLAIERYDAVDQELGERFVKFRLRSEDNTAKVRKAINNVGRDDPLRGDLEKAISEYLDSLPKPSKLAAIPQEYEEALITVSDFTATARSHVQRDRNHDLVYKPRPEVGTRLGKELAKLFLALVVVREKPSPTEEELRTVVRVAEDCLPPNRLAVLRVLRRANAPVETPQIEDETGLPHSIVWLALDDLSILKLVRREPTPPGSGAVQWELAQEWGERLADLPMLAP